MGLMGGIIFRKIRGYEFYRECRFEQEFQAADGRFLIKNALSGIWAFFDLDASVRLKTTIFFTFLYGKSWGQFLLLFWHLSKSLPQGNLSNFKWCQMISITSASRLASSWIWRQSFKMVTDEDIEREFEEFSVSIDDLTVLDKCR